ncbi:hypothetical protein JCM19296_1014 [Nonlabens ulvanivorans]|uniref:Uncharacterized protein n=1 Tax=Nonlabens ulvanivorans TaxID=906888 RepID=A0A081D926_NONUL|nr:tetratricopeptide repeat protein [Nonlabens ulvanivorans]GAK75422.1 hypothetical protein JCM19296_1014 [Nonlabens ulvanivorans]
MITPDNLLLEKYFKNSLTHEEHAQFEIRKKDSKFVEQLIIEQQLHDTFHMAGWSFANNVDKTVISEYQELFNDEDIVNLKATLKNIDHSSEPIKSRYDFRWKHLIYAAAASVVIIISVSQFNGTNSTPDHVYATYLDKNQLTYSIVRDGDSQSALDEATALFIDEKYKEAMPIIENSIITSQENLPAFYLLKGISLMEMGSYDDAIIVYDQLISSDFLDAEKGYWYKGLLYLKKGDEKKALMIFNKIRKEHLYNAGKATEIIELLN